MKYIKIIRPQQWVKNLFVFVPAFFNGDITDGCCLLVSLIVFAAFSLAASSIYCLNDIIDVEDDRRHPVKCLRPVASGAVSVPQAYTVMGVSLALSLAVMTLVPANRWQVFAAVAGYWGMLTAGRFLIGCVANRLGNRRQIRLSMVLSFTGALLLTVPGPAALILCAVGLIGFAFASFYPAMMHAAPERFDDVTAATVIGYQGGAAMLGAAVIPAAFGYLAARTTFALLPWFVAAVTVVIFLLQLRVDGRRK